MVFEVSIQTSNHFVNYLRYSEHKRENNRFGKYLYFLIVRTTAIISKRATHKHGHKTIIAMTHLL